MTDEPGVPTPNYTQIPNMIFDLMPLMNDTELRVVLFIARQTFGWHKKRDKLSISQIMAGTGLSNGGVIAGVEAGIERGLIRRTAISKTNPRKGFYYSLLVKSVHKACESSSQGLVNPVHIQKKGKETLQKKKEGEAAPPTDTTPAPERPAPPPSPLNDQHPFVVVFREVVGGFLNKVQRAELEAMPLDSASVDKWREVLRVWMLNDWNRRNVPGMIDRYRKEGQPAAAPTPQTRVRNGIEEHKHGGVWYPAHSVQGASR
jgi:hypothetical protein